MFELDFLEQEVKKQKMALNIFLKGVEYKLGLESDVFSDVYNGLNYAICRCEYEEVDKWLKEFISFANDIEILATIIKEKVKEYKGSVDYFGKQIEELLKENKENE